MEDIERIHMAIEAIFFDLDNTLLDFNRAERAALQRCCPATALPPHRRCWPGIMSSMTTTGNSWSWEILRENRSCSTGLTGCWKNWGYPATAPGFPTRMKISWPQGKTSIEGARELLDDLKEKYMLCLATNGAAHVQRLRLHNSGLDKDFAHIFISEGWVRTSHRRPL